MDRKKASDQSHWRLEDAVIMLSDGPTRLYRPSPADVLRCEYKGHTSVAGRSVESRPSFDLAGVTIERFPMSVRLLLSPPDATRVSGSVTCTLEAFGPRCQVPLTHVTSDQITHDQRWYPLAVKVSVPPGS